MGNTYDAAVATAAANTTKATVGAQVVSKTLDIMNRTAPAKGKGKYKAGGDMAASYDVNKTVLSAAYNPTGTITELKT